MGVTEIVLLVLGAIVYIISFIIPARREKLSKETLAAAEKEIKVISEKVTEEAKDQIQDMVKETADYGVEKTERAMERVCNEKIMAINEYSDTVLEAINKNHTEVMFLYDMLNEKHSNLKNTALEVEKKAKEVKQTVEEISVPVSYIPVPETVASEDFVPMMGSVPVATVAPKPRRNAKTASADTINDADATATSTKTTGTKTTSTKTTSAKATGTRRSTSKSKTKDAEGPELNLRMNGGVKAGGRNSNDRILELHKEGKSNVSIAKELGLGIGEVKLVIDLFEGMKS